MKNVYPLFLGDVNLNGQFLADNKEKLKKYMLGLGGKRAQLLIKPLRKTRTLRQNAWYWGCILELMEEHTGHTKEELHEAMKLMFNVRMVTVGSTTVPTPGTTTKMTTKDFSDFIERVRAFAASELGINIPDPNTIQL